jgi:HPr kinase/phosphorylase
MLRAEVVFLAVRRRHAGLHHFCAVQRTGLENEYYDILGVSIPSTSIPVSPGRNLAVVLETAAINNRQKKMGYNAARELLIRLGLDDKMD